MSTTSGAIAPMLPPQFSNTLPICYPPLTKEGSTPCEPSAPQGLLSPLQGIH